MIIVIPSNREKVITIEKFSKRLIENTIIDRRECEGNIANKRQSIIDELYNDSMFRYVIMVDDDISFQHRDKTDKHVNSGEKEIENLFLWIDDKLKSGYEMVGVSNRFMVNSKPSTYEASNPSMIYGLDLEFIFRNNLSFNTGGLKLCEDWHLVLSMYEKGARNIFTSDWCVSDSSKGKGGLEKYRKSKDVIENMKIFKSLHRDFVDLRVKEGGVQQRNLTNLSMTVRWKKAYKKGLETL